MTFAAIPSLGQQSRFRVLAFYSETTEPDHVQFARDAVKYLSARAASEHFTFDSTSKWEDLNAERLKGYQLVIWLNESPSKAEQRSAFERYIEHGGAWLGFHAAAYNDRDTNWPWFVDFLGGAVFSMNSWPPLPAQISIDDEAHPVTVGIGHDFESPLNEWYIWKPDPRVSKNVRVLATLDPSNYPMGYKDILTSGDLPVVWTNTKYKMLYVNMGHGDKIFTSPVQNRLIENAVNWLGTGATLKPGEQGTRVKIRGAAVEGNGVRVSPHGIVVNPESGKFYAVNTAKNAVTVLDGDGRFVALTPVGREPVSIALNPDTNRMYVTNSGSGDVSVIDGNTDKVIATVPVGDLPYTITVNRASNKVYISRTFSDVTVIINGKTNEPTTVRAGVGDAVAADSLDDDVYMTSFESPQVTVLDTTTGQTSKVETPNHMWAMAVSPAAKKVYAVSVGNSNVTVMDGNSHAAKFMKAGQIPCAIAVDDSSGKAYVPDFGRSDVTVIDGKTDSVVGSVNVGPKPQAISIDPSSHKVYVASMHESTVTVLDGANSSVVGTVRTKQSPFAIAVNSKTHVVAVLSLNGEVTLIDGATLTTSSPSIPKDER